MTSRKYGRYPHGVESATAVLIDLEPIPTKTNVSPAIDVTSRATAAFDDRAGVSDEQPHVAAITIADASTSVRVKELLSQSNELELSCAARRVAPQ